jgi:hypothetical protein
MPLFIINTYEIVKKSYIVLANTQEHAADEVSMLDSGSSKDFFYPFEEKSLPSQIDSIAEVNIDEYFAHKPEIEAAMSYIRKVEYLE